MLGMHTLQADPCVNETCVTSYWHKIDENNNPVNVEQYVHEAHLKFGITIDEGFKCMRSFYNQLTGEFWLKDTTCEVRMTLPFCQMPR